MASLDPTGWSWWTYWLYGFALYCAGGLVWYWFRFARLEAAVRVGEPGAVAAFNAAVRGFPNSVYAKMLGRRALEESADGGSPPGH